MKMKKLTKRHWLSIPDVPKTIQNSWVSQIAISTIFSGAFLPGQSGKKQATHFCLEVKST